MVRLVNFHCASSRIMAAAAKRMTMALATALACVVFNADTKIAEDAQVSLPVYASFQGPTKRVTECYEGL